MPLLLRQNVDVGLGGAGRQDDDDPSLTQSEGE
jgi:hypothetical protein